MVSSVWLHNHLAMLQQVLSLTSSLGLCDHISSSGSSHHGFKKWHKSFCDAQTNIYFFFTGLTSELEVQHLSAWSAIIHFFIYVNNRTWNHTSLHCCWWWLGVFQSVRGQMSAVRYGTRCLTAATYWPRVHITASCKKQNKKLFTFSHLCHQSFSITKLMTNIW